VMVLNCLMVGTGEYTTGYSPSSTTASDKSAGVVGITLFDLKRRGKVGVVGLCGVNGTKFPAIRKHLAHQIGTKYKDMNCETITFPEDGVVDPLSYVRALDHFEAGDAVTVFTPDDTHFEITLAAIKRGMHVLTTKPLVKTIEEHLELCKAAKENNVLVMCEVHKRFDPIYADASKFD